jgi:putative YhbY family RNA-binding protein
MLTGSERKALKGKAHKLEPVVQIGAKGLTDEVFAEIERALIAHELIKVRAAGLERDARSSLDVDLRKDRRASRAAGGKGLCAVQEER